MKVLFIGGTGIISLACTKRAVEKGFQVFHLNRGETTHPVPKEVTRIQGDIRDAASVQEALKPYQFDVVVDWIAFVEDHVQLDIRLFSGKIKQYIFISSASIYQKPVSHYIITESTPIHNPFWTYSQNKIQCELALMEAYRKNDFPATIVRPSYTYSDWLIPIAVGPGNFTIIDRMKKGKKIIVHGDGTSLWTMTHSSDFAKGFVGLLGNEQTIGHPFHITSDEVLTWNQIYRFIGQAVNTEPNIIHIPSDTINRMVPDIGAGLLGDKAHSVIFDNTKIKRFVPEFQATMAFSKGIQQSIDWFMSDQKRMTINEEANQLLDNIITRYEQTLL